VHFSTATGKVCGAIGTYKGVELPSNKVKSGGEFKPSPRKIRSGGAWVAA
jgi:hypothetical protein